MSTTNDDAPRCDLDALKELLRRLHTSSPSESLAGLARLLDCSRALDEDPQLWSGLNKALDGLLADRRPAWSGVIERALVQAGYDVSPPALVATLSGAVDYFGMTLAMEVLGARPDATEIIRAWLDDLDDASDWMHQQNSWCSVAKVAEVMGGRARHPVARGAVVTHRRRLPRRAPRHRGVSASLGRGRGPVLASTPPR